MFLAIISSGLCMLLFVFDLKQRLLPTSTQFALLCVLQAAKLIEKRVAAAAKTQETIQTTRNNYQSVGARVRP